MVAQTKTPMRRIPGYRAITVAILAACMACTTTPRPSTTHKSAVSAPVVPLMSIHQYWDHHWFVWLPRHPTYEAVEIMSIDAPSNPYKAVWVFLTEREGSKRATPLLRRPQNRRGFRGQPLSRHRLSTHGQGRPGSECPGGAVRPRRDDHRDRHRCRQSSAHSDGCRLDRSIRSLCRRAPAAVLSRPQCLGDHEHGADRWSGFLVSRRRRSGRKTPLCRGVYSSGIQLALIPFGHWSFSADGARFDEESSDLSFAVAARDQETSLVADLPGYRNRVTIVMDSNGALRRYAHDAASHRLVMTLDQALPLDRYAPRAVGAFSIHMDPDDPVAHGQVVSEPTAAGRRLSWRFVLPSWAVDYPFESIIDTGSGRVALTTRSLRAQ